MIVYLVLDRLNRIRGFPYLSKTMAQEAMKEANALWDGAKPHRIVEFVPKEPLDAPLMGVGVER